MNIMISDFLQFSHKFLQILELAVFLKKNVSFHFLSFYLDLHVYNINFNTVKYQ